ncbi:gamma-glutamylcyclotransferase family protein [Negadavirga shengliensis]|uniref:Gamma-glutamylcyclotransferase n=1 Tax=Negadavirga shengliensis TaxID=1389218 RepID=A0ABV9T810_9BACT
MAGEATLFVYGTLRSGFGHPMWERLRNSSSLLGEGYFCGLLYDLGPYPAAVRSAHEEEVVRGEIYALEDEENLLEALDRYEGIDEKLDGVAEYTRKKVKAFLDGGREYWSWVYLYEGYTDHLVPIPEGDYLKYLNEKDNLGY